MKNTGGQTAPEGFVLISEAVRLSGLARSTFYEYISAEKITVSVVNFRGKDKKFIALSELQKVFGNVSGKPSDSDTIEHLRAPDTSGQDQTLNPDTIEQPRTHSPDTSELVRLRKENAVLLARLEEVREAKATAERDKENLSHLLAGSLETVKFLELRSMETAQLLALRTVENKPEKKPGFFARLFNDKPKG